MKFIRKFENFVNDLNREDQSTSFVHSYNPVNKVEAEKYVDSVIKAGDWDILFKVTGTEKPKGELSPEDFDEKFDDMREKAIKYFVENPKGIGAEPAIKSLPKPSGDGIPRTNNVGGTSFANSPRIGE